MAHPSDRPADHPAGPVRPLLAPRELDALRSALEPYTVEALHEALGPIGRAAHARADLAGVARAARTFGDRTLATFATLFLLGEEVDADDARAALWPLPLEAAAGAGLIEESAGAVRGRLDLRPYGEAGSGDRWWLLSDFGSDVTGAPLAADHVLGVGAAALTLAQATPRTPVGRALDLGTGCGVQALHLAGHAEHVCGTDISGRALRLAATTAALSGQQWELRAGSWLEPVAGDTFDLIVCNPPFVVSPGSQGGSPDGASAADRYDYRDSGLAGDEVCRRLVTGVPDLLAPGGTAQLLANWIVPADGSWRERLESWFSGSGCDAWVWQREVAEPAEYVELWLRDAGQARATPAWRAHYERWVQWFAANEVAAIGMGLVTMWPPDPASGGGTGTAVVVEDVPQPLAPPLGLHVASWIARRRWLTTHTDADVLGATYVVDRDLVRTRQDLLGDAGWATAHATLRQSHGLRWEVEVDDNVSAVLAACAAGSTPALAVELLSATHGIADRDADSDAATGLAPVLRDLIGRGFLTPGTMA